MSLAPIQQNSNGDNYAMAEVRRRIADKFRNAQTQERGSNMPLLEWAMKYIPHHFTRKFSRFHTTLASKYDKTNKRGQKICVIAPRGNAKTTITLAKILKSICEGTEHFILLVMDTADQSTLLLSSVVYELESNDKLRQDYPAACAKGKTWNTTRIETQNAVCVEALGTGQKVRGKKFRQWRPSLIIVDDPDNDKDVRSPTVRLAHIDWFNKALLECGDTETNFFVIGTMIHRECIVAECEKRPDFQTIKFASIIKWPIDMGKWKEWEQLFWADVTPVHKHKANKRATSADAQSKDHTKQRGSIVEALRNDRFADEVIIDDNETMGSRNARMFYQKHKEAMEEGADVLWPEKEDLYALMVKRASNGHASFESEKQNNPRDPSKCSFREEWFEGTEYDDSELHKLIASNSQRTTVTFLDPAKGKETRRGDDSAIISMHHFESLNYVYVECYLDRVPMTELTDRLVVWLKQTFSQFCGVEAQGFQELLSEELVTKLEEDNQFGIGVVPMQTMGVNKNVRIDRLSIYFHRKFFRFKRGCPHTKKLLDQALDYPFADKDDGLDALEGCTRLLSHCLGAEASNEEQISQLPNRIQ